MAESISGCITICFRGCVATSTQANNREQGPSALTDVPRTDSGCSIPCKRASLTFQRLSSGLSSCCPKGLRTKKKIRAAFQLYSLKTIISRILFSPRPRPWLGVGGPLNIRLWLHCGRSGLDVGQWVPCLRPHNPFCHWQILPTKPHSEHIHVDIIWDPSFRIKFLSPSPKQKTQGSSQSKVKERTAGPLSWWLVWQPWRDDSTLKC